jgi:hypothetical protein
MVYFYIIDVPAAIAVDYWFYYADVGLRRVSAYNTECTIENTTLTTAVWQTYN